MLLALIFGCLLALSVADIPTFTSDVVDASKFSNIEISPVTCSGVSNPNASISKVFFAQTHIMTPLENPFFFLIEGRPALLKVNVLGSVPDSISPEVSVLAQFLDGTSQKFCLAGPTNLPTSFTSVQQANDSFVVTLPASWINAGLANVTITALGGGSQFYNATDLDLDGKIIPFTFLTMDFMLFGKDSAPRPKPQGFKDQYWAMMPFTSINYLDFPVNITLDKLAVGPRGDTKDLVAHMMDSYPNSSTAWAGFGLISAVLTYQNVVRDANAMGSYAHGYGCIAGGVGGGLGGGSGGAGDDYQGIFFHEFGHAFGLGHGQNEYSANQNPYPGNQNPTPGGAVGTTWSYEQDTGYFVPTWPESPVDMTKEKQDPMQGGAGDQRNGRLFTMWSDYNARRIYNVVASSAYANAGVVQFLPATMGPNAGNHYILFNQSGRAFWKDDVTPAADGSKFVRWDYPTKQYKAIAAGTEFPVKLNVPVFTVVGSWSNTTTEVQAFYPRLYYRGNLKKLINPNNDTDWEYVRTTNYCYWGCDFHLQAHYANGTVLTALIQNDQSRKTGWTDPTSGTSYFMFASNFPDFGVDLVKTQLYYRPLSKLGGGVANGFPGGGAIINASDFFAGATLLMEDTSTTTSLTGCSSTIYSASCVSGQYVAVTCDPNVLCSECKNGGSTYSCATGRYKSGTACDGTTSTDTQTCPLCSNGGANYVCSTGSYKNTASCDGTTTSDVQTCTGCANGGINYNCGAGSYRNGTICNGFGTVDTQSCAPCGNGGLSYSCPAGYYLSGVACDGTANVDTQVCSPCANGGATYDCGTGKINGLSCSGQTSYDTQTCASDACLHFGCKYLENYNVNCTAGTGQRTCTCPDGSSVVRTFNENFEGCPGICPKLHEIKDQILANPHKLVNAILNAINTISGSFHLTSSETNRVLFEWIGSNGAVDTFAIESNLTTFLADYFCVDSSLINTTVTPAVRKRALFTYEVVAAFQSGGFILNALPALFGFLVVFVATLLF